MEKFGVYVDKGSGIMPFKATSFHLKWYNYIILGLLFVIKAITVLPILISGLAFYLFSATYRTYLDLLLAYFFNVTDVDVTVDGVKKSDAAKMELSKPNKSDIIFINATSPLDKLIWPMISENPKSVSIAIVDSNAELRLVPSFGFSYVNWCLSGSTDIPSNWTKLDSPFDFKSKTFTFNDDQLIEFKTQLEKNVGNNTLFIIPEGTITNNRGLLTFAGSFNAGSFSQACAQLGRNIKTASVKLTPMGNTGTVVPTGKFRWLFLNFGSVAMDIKCKIIMSVLFTRGDEPNTIKKLTNELVREKMSIYGRLKLLSSDLTVSKKQEYINNIKEKKYI